MSAHRREQIADVARYYRRSESRVGYRALLRGTKHFGFYRRGDRTFPFGESLRRMEDRVGQALALPPGSLVLDAGCGTGDLAIHLASTKRWRVLGIDILFEDIVQAGEKASTLGVADATGFVCMSYDDLGFAEAWFDGICTLESLAHAADPDEVVNEFWRALKPGGRIALFEYSHAPLEAMPTRGRHVLTEVNRATAMAGFQLFQHGALAESLLRTGFTNVSVEDISHHIIPMIRALAIIAAPWYVTVGVLARRKDKVPNAMAAVEFWRMRDYIKYTIVTAEKPRTADPRLLSEDGTKE